MLLIYSICTADFSFFYSIATNIVKYEKRGLATSKKYATMIKNKVLRLATLKHNNLIKWKGNIFIIKKVVHNPQIKIKKINHFIKAKPPKLQGFKPYGLGGYA